MAALSPPATASFWCNRAAAPGRRRSPDEWLAVKGGTGNAAALQGAGDRGRRNTQVGGGLPWRDAGRQCSGQRFRSRRKQCMPGRLSSGLLAQQSSELAPVRLAAIERNAN